MIAIFQITINLNQDCLNAVAQRKQVRISNKMMQISNLRNLLKNKMKKISKLTLNKTQHQLYHLKGKNDKN